MKRKLLLCIVIIAVFPLVVLLTALLANAVPLLSAAPSAPAVASEDDRDSSTPTSWYWYYHQTSTQITNLVSSLNLRIVDLNVETTTVPHKFSAAFVVNSGVYAKTWDWGYDLTASDVANLIAGSTKRIISFKAYELTPGDVRYAVV